MSQNGDSGAWRTTRDHEEIQEWAAEHDAVPVDRGASQPDLGFEPVPEEGMPWSRFFGVFDSEDLAFRYRPNADEIAPNYEIVSHEAAADSEPVADETRRTEGMNTGHLSQSDTGDAEPVTDAHRGTAEDADATPAAATADHVRGPTPAADQLVLDSVHEHRPGLGDSQDEHVSLENAAEEPLDLSGWRLRNGEGLAFEFPPETTIEPDTTVRVHSGDGRDEANDYYWGTDDVVWPTRGGTVVVETPDGHRALEADYKGGSGAE
ncbi:lamin tail domain-containing protein [Halosimplex amylolyticum]|uniref:lamin tail domain-containing protein n=1 Tax=Halosimplex amylolyticum TaxID=3396616 RepID=UPI003F547DF4